MYGRGTAQILILALIVVLMAASTLTRAQEWCCAAPEEPLCPDPDLRSGPEPVLECPHPSGEAATSRLTLVNALLALIALLAGLIGFAYGRRTAPKPPSESAVDGAVLKAATNRIAEANRHGIGTAVPLLEKLRDDAAAEVKKLLPKK
jgi:hypothetical protein